MFLAWGAASRASSVQANNAVAMMRAIIPMAVRSKQISLDELQDNRLTASDGFLDLPIRKGEYGQIAADGASTRIIAGNIYHARGMSRRVLHDERARSAAVQI